MESGCSSSASSAPGGGVVQVCFPSVQGALLASLNRQRLEGQLCDLAIEVQGRVFRAHRCVLAASSPYFHDQVLLKNVSSVSLPAVLDPLAFESVLGCAYTGRLRMLSEEIVNYLTVGSVLQMWHIVDKCTELLKEGRGPAAGRPGARAGAAGAGDPPAAPGRRPSLGSSRASESQSPSSTNYFSPREAGGSGFGGAPTSATSAGEDGGAAGGAGTFLIEEEEGEGDEEGEEEEEEEEEVYPRRRGTDRGAAPKRHRLGRPEPEDRVSDCFGVSSYQDGDPPPPPAPPSLLPRRHWVVVKTERPPQAEDEEELLVVSGGAGEDEDELGALALAGGRPREHPLSISDVRTLSGAAELPGRGAGPPEAQVDFCESSGDYVHFDAGQPPPPEPLHHRGDRPALPGPRALLGPVPPGAGPPRAQLFPLDMQGNPVLLYSPAPPPAPVAAGAELGAEHGPVAPAGGGGAGGGAGGGGAGGGAKVFMCHCGKTFTHKSMRDRHVNMHLNLRPFDCPVCAKKFKMKHHLTEHMKTHTGLKPYDCRACGKKFMWRDSFMRHRAHCERRGGPAHLQGGAAALALGGPGALLAAPAPPGGFGAAGAEEEEEEEEVCEVSVSEGDVT